jgi:hypothetical protein
MTFMSSNGQKKKTHRIKKMPLMNRPDSRSLSNKAFATANSLTLASLWTLQKFTFGVLTATDSLALTLNSNKK